MENRPAYRPLTIDALREYRESLKNALRAEQENPVRPNETWIDPHARSLATDARTRFYAMLNRS
jgi:hypothetical protein